MVKYGGGAALEWMALICDLALRPEVPNAWRKAVIVPLHKSKGIRISATTIGVLVY